MMEKKKLIEYARKGLMAEIREHEATIAKGRGYLNAMDKGERVNTPLARSEIEAVIAKAKAKVEALSNEERELRLAQALE